uniref:DDE_3 domain-containing protein n=1 Tax=Haemonchus contortus TaxID=6289 RepID=A0A7I4XXU5_HAECO
MVEPSPDRSAIVRLHKAGRPPATIAKHLGIHRSVVYRTLQRRRDLVGLQDHRRSGRPRSARTPKVVESVRKRIARNATRNISTMAGDMGISRKSMERLKTILEDALLPWANSCFNGRPWTFQQDSAPAHKAKVVQAWCKSELPDFISAEEWPASSPDLNPLDHDLWSYLESKACATPHPNLDSLKAALIREWDEIDDVLLRPVVDAFPKRLRAVVRAKGGRIKK